MRRRLHPVTHHPQSTTASRSECVTGAEICDWLGGFGPTSAVYGSRTFYNMILEKKNIEKSLEKKGKDIDLWKASPFLSKAGKPQKASNFEKGQAKSQKDISKTEKYISKK